MRDKLLPMKPLFVSAALLVVGLAAPAVRGQEPADPAARYFYPLSKPKPAPEVTLDVSETPEAHAFAENSKRLVEQWFPIVCQLLSTDEYAPPKTLKLVFRKQQNAPAFATGGRGGEALISVSTPWITAHPDDYGMIIHEMTHVIQSYRGRGERPGWLTEGIADYIRFYRYEPDVPRPRVNPQRASYKDSYRTTAAFLAWVTGKYDRRLVARLDASLRDGSYTGELWTTVTGKDVDTLWAEFIVTLPRPAA